MRDDAARGLTAVYRIGNSRISKRVVDRAAAADHLLGHAVVVVVHGAFQDVEHYQGGVAAHFHEPPEPATILAAQLGFGNPPHEPAEQDDGPTQVGGLGLDLLPAVVLPPTYPAGAEGDLLPQINVFEATEVGVRLVEIAHHLQVAVAQFLAINQER